MSLDQFDVWMAVNGQRLRDGNTAMLELMPYVNTTARSDQLQPLIARLEAATSDVTYSEFDAGHVSAMYAHAGSSFRAGLDAMAQGNGAVAGTCVSHGLDEYKDAVDCLLAEISLHEQPEPARSGRRWWLVASLVLLLLVILI